MRPAPAAAWASGIPARIFTASCTSSPTVQGKLIYITLPNLLPTMGMLWVVGLINTFKVFREAWLVAGSYPHESMYLVQHLFQNWFSALDIGRLSAGAVMMAAALLGGIALVQGVMNRRADR